MDHDEAVLSLSDVVHDDPLDDDDTDMVHLADPTHHHHLQHLQQHHNHHHQQQEHHLHHNSSSFHDPSSLHEPYSDPSPHHAHSLSGEPFSVEMLEREITSLLNQNASAASAALLSAAAQQRQANFEQECGRNPTGDSPSHPVDEGIQHSENLASLGGLSLTSLAAVLQAAHAQAELTGTDVEFARRRDAATLVDETPRTTRSAPAFHSLTAGDSPCDSSADPTRNRSGVNNNTASRATDYLYGHQTHERDDEEGHDDSRHLPPSLPRSDDPSTASPHLPGTFNDINDIFTHMGQLDHDSDHDRNQHMEPTVPDSPIVSRAQSDVLPSASPPPLTALTSSSQVNTPQPTASTSTTRGQADSEKPKRKTSEKVQSSHNLHFCDHDLCQKSFTRKSDLARHVRIHTGERPFVCSYPGCGKTFIQRSALHVHERVHTGEKPHSCEHVGCNRHFGDSSSLARHRRTHTGKRPYKCEDPTCEKTFTRRTTLTQHMRTHDPSWEPDPNIKYVKGKKRRIAGPTDLEESVRAISALLSSAGTAGITGVSTDFGPTDGPMEARVASISAEIAAAIAQAQARAFEDDEDEDEEEDEEDEESGSGQDMNVVDKIGPNTSGIRGVNGTGGGAVSNAAAVVATSSKEAARMVEQEFEDDDSDAFPVPLRKRRKRPIGVRIGTKRKRYA